MDNTAAPMICRPLDHGAAIVVHSTTKYIGGHGTSIGGMIVDGGNFDWAAHAKRFPTLNEPDPSYHGAVWTEAVKPLGPIAYIIRARVVLLRDIGACMSPFNAFQFIQGLETLPLRMREHCRNAADGRAPSAEPSATSRASSTPACTTTPSSAAAPTPISSGFGGIVGFELKQGREAGARFIDALKMFYHVANIGDARSLAIHPASTTHSQLSPADQLASGVTPGYVRLSVGIEHIDDIIADLDQALTTATATKTTSQKPWRRPEVPPGARAWAAARRRLRSRCGGDGSRNFRRTSQVRREYRGRCLPFRDRFRSLARPLAPARCAGASSRG